MPPKRPEIDRFPKDPLDPQRVNRAVFVVEDSMGLLTFVGALLKHWLWLSSVGVAIFLLLRPDMIDAVLEIIK